MIQSPDWSVLSLLIPPHIDPTEDLTDRPVFSGWVVVPWDAKPKANHRMVNTGARTEYYQEHTHPERGCFFDQYDQICRDLRTLFKRHDWNKRYWTVYRPDTTYQPHPVHGKPLPLP